MRTIISSERGKNQLWIQTTKDIIQSAEVIVTDYKKIEELKRKLRYFPDYEYIEKITREGFSTEKLVFTLDGADKYSNDFLSTNYDPNKIYQGPTYQYEIEKYQNPRSETLRMITGNLRNNHELIWLFNHENIKALKDVNFVELIISQLSQGLIDEETVIKILKNIWPDFYTFSTEALSCIDLDIIKNYSLEQLQETPDIEHIAKRNAKVLTLARKVKSI